MEPFSWTSVIAGAITVIAAVLGYRKFVRTRNENMAQAEADELKHSMDRADQRIDPALSGLRVDEKDRT